jgi:hypothetical protein
MGALGRLLPWAGAGGVRRVAGGAVYAVAAGVGVVAVLLPVILLRR